MDIFNALGGIDTAQQQLSQQLGTDPQQTASALEAAVPLLLGAITRNATTPDGAAALDNALNDHSGDTLGLFQQGQLPDMTTGQGILGHVFGSQQNSAVNAVAQRAGISPQLAMQILMIAAPLVMNYLARQRGGQSQSGGLGGDLGSVLGSVLGGNMGSNMGGGVGGGLGSILGSVLGGNMGGGLGGMLGGMLGGGQSQQAQGPTQQGYAQPDYQQQGNAQNGGSMFPGYTDNSGAGNSGLGNVMNAGQQPQQHGGGLLGTLESALGGGNSNALEDLIGMFGGKR